MTALEPTTTYVLLPGQVNVRRGIRLVRHLKSDRLIAVLADLAAKKDREHDLIVVRRRRMLEETVTARRRRLPAIKRQVQSLDDRLRTTENQIAALRWAIASYVQG